MLTEALAIPILGTMEVHFSPDLQMKLNRVAAENGGDPDGYIQQLVEHYVDPDAWFRQKVKRGLEQLERGEYISHEEDLAAIVAHIRKDDPAAAQRMTVSQPPWLGAHAMCAPLVST